MKYCGLYHLNAYTYADPTWFPDMDRGAARDVREGDQGLAVGQRRASRRQGRLQDQRPVRRHAATRASSAFRSSTATSRRRRSNSSTRRAKPDKPFFMNVNFMKVHQPNMPHPDYIHKSMSKSKYADSVVELDARIGRIMDKVRGARPATRTRWCSTRPTTAPGRTSIPTPATRRSAAPRAPCAKAATACRPSPGCPARSRPARRTTTSSAAST